MIWLSVPLGLLAWGFPIGFHAKKPAAVSAVSFSLCGLALLNVLWELYRRTASGDYAALMDVTDNLVWCSVALVVGTVLLNLRLHAPNGILQNKIKPFHLFITLLILSAVYLLRDVFILWFFSMIAFAFCSVWYLCNRRYLLSLGAEIGTWLSFSLFSPGWIDILVSSGKNTRFFGLEEYAWIVIPLGLLLLGSSVCAVFSVSAASDFTS